MHDVEDAVAHDDFLFARTIADEGAQLGCCLDLMPIALGQ